MTNKNKSAIALLGSVLLYCIDKHAEITIVIRPNNIEHIDYKIRNIPDNKNVSREALTYLKNI